jgi:hypothetical protein
MIRHSLSPVGIHVIQKEAKQAAKDKAKQAAKDKAKQAATDKAKRAKKETKEKYLPSNAKRAKTIPAFSGGA